MHAQLNTSEPEILGHPVVYNKPDYEHLELAVCTYVQAIGGIQVHSQHVGSFLESTCKQAWSRRLRPLI
jgi:hypothetical protein